jgi:hypothetical protein
MGELGKIEKPSAESFAGKRKLYCVPNIYPLNEAPEDYSGLVNRFWDEVVQQTERLEAAGKIKKIFCESISVGGEEAYDALTRINERALQFVRKKVEEGAELFPVEKEEIFSPFLDWANCLSIVRTKEVFSKVLEFYSNLSSRRLQHAAELIDGNLKEDEAGLLIMRDEDRVQLQLKDDIEVFLVTPPAYDDILRWFRDKARELNT